MLQTAVLTSRERLDVRLRSVNGRALKKEFGIFLRSILELFVFISVPRSFKKHGLAHEHTEHFPVKQAVT